MAETIVRRKATLQRRTPLRAKHDWQARFRERWKERERERVERRDGRSGTLKRKTPLKKISKSQRRQLSQYMEKQRDFLERFPVCLICLVRGMNPAPATEVHHYRGRTRKLLADVRWFVPSCRGCRMFPHDHPTEARALGVLAPANEWKVCPGPDVPGLLLLDRVKIS